MTTQEEIEEWCIIHKIPIGYREDLIELVDQYGEEQYEVGREEGYYEGKEEGHRQGVQEGYENGKSEGYQQGLYDGKRQMERNIERNIDSRFDLDYQQRENLKRKIIRGENW